MGNLILNDNIEETEVLKEKETILKEFKKVVYEGFTEL